MRRQQTRSVGLWSFFHEPPPSSVLYGVLHRALVSIFRLRGGIPASGAAIPYVAPGAGWTGAAKSGGVPAVFPAGVVTADPITRTTAKPAIHWLVPSNMVLVPGTDLVIGVDADASGTAGGSLFGISQVNFWVEGTTQTVTTPSFYTDTDANGASRTRWGYFIKLRQSDFAAHLTGSEVRIFATAVPNDTAMQNRVIGYDLFNAGLDDGNYPLSVLPRSTANDFAYTVNATNNDVTPNFTTLKKALTQGALDNAERPIITFTATGFYEAENLTNHVSIAKAFCTVTHSVGVVATIRRAVAYTPNSPSSWPWTPGWDGIEFRGSGIVFDQRNWSIIQLSRPSWFNGCKFTNSIGTRDSLYWNNGTGPGFVGTGPLMCWMDSVYSEFVSGVFMNNYYGINCQWKQTGGSIFTGNHYIYNTYGRDYSNSFFRNPINRISITYTNPGGHTTASISRPASVGSGNVLTLKVDGTAVTTIALGYYSNEVNPTVQDVVNAINAFAAGWSASVLNAGGAWSASLIGFNGSSWAQTDVNAFGITVNFNATPDPHGEWWQGYGPSSAAQSPPARENVLHRNNVARDSATEPFWNNDDSGNGDQSQDHIYKGNIFLGGGQNTGFGGNASGANSMGHMVFENNTIETNSITRSEDSIGDKVYSSYRNNIIHFGYSNGMVTRFTGGISGGVLTVSAMAAGYIGTIGNGQNMVLTPAMTGLGANTTVNITGAGAGGGVGTYPIDNGTVTVAGGTVLASNGNFNGQGYFHSMPWINNVYRIPPNVAPMTGGSNAGNIDLGDGGVNNPPLAPFFSNLFLNVATGDVRPVVAGLLLSNLKPKINTYARDGTAFATSDIAGALAALSPAPSWPF
jgi:hypothetical protein